MEKNSSTLELFLERFPKLGFLAPTWEPSECDSERLKTADPGKAEAVYVYGIGGGAPYFQLQGWLREKPERKLIFLEDEPGCLASFLRLEEAKEILENGQVQIELLEDVQELAEKYPIQRIEIFSLPSRTGKKFRALRLQLLRKTALAYALHVDRLHGYQPFHNFVQNLRRLPESFYANRLKGAFQGIPAVVCGAGPSLKEAIPILRGLENKALVIAGGSTLAALSSQLVQPHFGMAIDPNLEEYRRMKNSFTFEVPLLYSTRVFPAIFQTCNGPFGYMRSGIGGVPEIWMEEELGLLDPLIGEQLSPESISVTTICVAIAQFFGCDPIYLSGVDLAYTGNKRYAEGVGGEDEVFFSLLDAEKSAADRIVKRRDRNGKTVRTAIRWVMESASISHFAKKHRETRFFNTTEGGIGFKDIPFLPLGEAKFDRSYNLRGMIQERICSAPMPPQTGAMIREKMEALKESLDRLISHLEILASKKGGSKPLAELELQEEMALSFLFYDIHTLLPAEEKWSRFLDLANKYKLTVSG
jgi:hypothetical protein